MIIGKRDKEIVRDLVYGNTMLKKQIEWLKQEIKVLSQIEDELKADNKALRDENRSLKEDLELQREEHERWTKFFNEKLNKQKPQYDFYPDFTYQDTDTIYIAREAFDDISEEEEAYIKSDIDLVNEIMDNSQTPNEMFDELLVESAYNILDSDYKDKYDRAREAFLMVNDKHARTIGLHAVLSRILKDKEEQ